VQIDSNENPYGPSPKAMEAITASERVASRYPDASEDQVVEAIAAHHGVKPENVALGCGSGEVLRVSDMAFTGPGTKVVSAEPTFEAVLHFCKLLGADAVHVPLTPDFRHDLDKMAVACGPTVHLAYVCNPNNPTGTIVSADELRGFLSKVPTETKVLVDEAYHHFVVDKAYGTTIPWIADHPNLIVARTFSKIYGLAGMRLGYAVSSADNIKAMRPHFTFSNANAAVLAAAKTSLADEAHVVDQRTRNNETRDWLVSELVKDGRKHVPSHTNFVMIETGSDASTLIPRFREHGVLIGRRFPSMAEWIRVSIGTPAEMQAFVAALREIVPAKA
jgi:histidinol-phosphate aminotransferase